MGISDLGNGLGYIYIVNPITSNIVSNLKNTPSGAREAKEIGSMSRAMALNLNAYGYISIDAITGTGSLTAVTINGVNQLGSSLNYVNATVEETFAISVATEINRYTPAGFDYTAIAIGKKVYIFAPNTAGSTVNGEAITTSDTGNITITSQDIDGGSDAQNTYDSRSGYRFYINSNSNATQGTLSGAIEITNYIVQRDLSSSIPSASYTLSSGIITVIRKAAMQTAFLRSEGGAGTDDLEGIIPSGFAEGDILILRPGVTDGSEVITIKSTNNLDFAAGTDPITIGNVDAGGTNALIMQFLSGSFVEISRAQKAPYLSDLKNNVDTTDPTVNDDINDGYSVGSWWINTGTPDIFLCTDNSFGGAEWISLYQQDLGSFSGDIITNGATIRNALQELETALEIERYKTFDVITDAATAVWDFSVSKNMSLTLGGNRTLSIINSNDGDVGTLIVTQDGTGSRTLTLPANSYVVNGGGGAITLTTTAGAIDIISFVQRGTDFFWNYGNNFT